VALRKYKLACPHGHDDLIVRCVVDYPAILAADGSCAVQDLSAEPDIQDVDGTLGVDCGCWCSECDEWYWETDCASLGS
jgi:hypothetical protein